MIAGAVVVIRAPLTAGTVAVVAALAMFVRYGGRVDLGSDVPAAAAAALVVGAAALLLAVAALRLAASRLDAWDVRRIGRDATAVILEVAGSRLVVNRRAIVRLRVRVEPADGGQPYEAWLDEFGTRLAPGGRLDVRYDPARPRRVASRR